MRHNTSVSHNSIFLYHHSGLTFLFRTETESSSVKKTSSLKEQIEPMSFLKLILSRRSKAT